MPIKSIRTRYKEHTFRSRLEARWAVFMDVSGIGWKYEPSHLTVTYGDHKRLDWLPDFKLQDGSWAEVKGALPDGEFYRLMDLAWAVTERGQNVVVLGHFPEAHEDRWPIVLTRIEDVMWAVPWQGVWAGELPRQGIPHTRVTADLLLAGWDDGQPDWAEPGLSYARQARFPWD